MPRAAVIWYSQSGQTRAVARSFGDGLRQGGWDVVDLEVSSMAGFPFPWTVPTLIDVFTPAVRGASTPIGAVVVPDDVELVVVVYQVWFLAPSLPIRALLDVDGLLEGRDVVTIAACRSMWYSAERKMRNGVARARGTHRGTVVAIDQGPKWFTFVTTPRFLLTGRRDRLFGVLPPAGISEERLGEIHSLGCDIGAGPLSGVEHVLSSPEAYEIDPQVALADVLGERFLRAWGALLERTPEPLRGVVSGAFAAWFAAAIIGGIPAVLLARSVARERTDRWVLETLEFIPPSRPGSAPAIGGPSASPVATGLASAITAIGRTGSVLARAALVAVGSVVAGAAGVDRAGQQSRRRITDAEHREAET